MSEKTKLDVLDKKHTSTTHEEGVISIAGSWIDIDRTKIPYEGLLYPETMKFQIKPAQTKTIKYFSMLDEENPVSVNNALTYVISHHVRIVQDGKVVDPLRVIYEHDRFFFVMLVHVYSGAPTSLSFPTVCKKQTCKHKQDANITPYVLQYNPLSERAKEWLNSKTGYFIIPTKIGQFVYRPLTLQNSIDLTEFMMAQKRENNDIEPFFTKVAPLLMSKHDDLNIPSIYQEYLKLTDDAQKISAVKRIVELVDPRQLLELEINCQKCQEPFRTEISSISGLRNIFVVHDIDDIFNA